MFLPKTSLVIVGSVRNSNSSEILYSICSGYLPVSQRSYQNGKKNLSNMSICLVATNVKVLISASKKCCLL